MKSRPAEDAFARGVELFNRGRYFECHEVWESLWKSSRGEERVFYQGLIQAAAALLHARRGQTTGAAGLWVKAKARLDNFPAECRGIALGRLRDELEACLAPKSSGICTASTAPKLRLIGPAHARHRTRATAAPRG